LYPESEQAGFKQVNYTKLPENWGGDNITVKVCAGKVIQKISKKERKFAPFLISIQLVYLSLD